MPTFTTPPLLSPHFPSSPPLSTIPYYPTTLLSSPLVSYVINPEYINGELAAVTLNVTHNFSLSHDCFLSYMIEVMVGPIDSMEIHHSKASNGHGHDYDYTHHITFILSPYDSSTLEYINNLLTIIPSILSLPHPNHLTY